VRDTPLEGMQRRDFLRRIGGLAAVPLLGAWGAPARGAGPFDDYRALVCLVMYGGNDAHNMIVPLDARYATYVANRGPLALPQASLQANAVADPVQGPFGFHPRMTRTRDLFAGGKLAVVSNVGVLLRPTTKFDFQNRSQLPPLLFAHDNMQEHWFTAHPQAVVEDGWGGRLADLLRPANAELSPVSISVSSSGVFLKGASTGGHRINAYNPSGPIVQRILAINYDNPPANPQAVYETAITMARTNILQDQFGDMAVRAVETNDLILDAVYGSPQLDGNYSERIAIDTPFPQSYLGAQLRSVAMMIAARQALEAKRQIFFVSAGGGFDHHSDQFDAQHSVLRPSGNEPAILYGNHADLLLEVDEALKAFYDATIELGVQDKVTTFTASEFGRTLTSNGKGSDHGWGGHHLVMGGAVQGGKIYGTFHNMQVGAGNPLDAGQGRLIPDISVDQYAATMAKWMGASAADLNVVFPNLGNFGQTDLGFLT
jgi:uncharacterized protein (DUF1501 family)